MSPASRYAMWLFGSALKQSVKAESWTAREVHLDVAARQLELVRQDPDVLVSDVEVLDLELRGHRAQLSIDGAA